MPITKTMAYKVGEETFPTLESAQVAELERLLTFPATESKGITLDQFHYIIRDLVVKYAKEVVEILTCKPEEDKPARKPRSDKGTKRKKEMTAEEVQ